MSVSVYLMVVAAHASFFTGSPRALSSPLGSVALPHSLIQGGAISGNAAYRRRPAHACSLARAMLDALAKRGQLPVIVHAPAVGGEGRCAACWLQFPSWGRDVDEARAVAPDIPFWRPANTLMANTWAAHN
ncbi:uncharacterized protein TRAVEDRAFT_70454 [Trametes versicolor FP-101664 SS1]|uniref:uncharacterized protein n=1 Tax=Trametes versicolor (strain FP-101664) TaxID=717944 RepID=UPI0004622C95|nr:uncharacterized protein TRAVEDRAFT_70454 [Trametes versicolor FP-101664 SS1]EIW62351.1 hypothetical protein TRAVEDRAFT_70454 [Trametes versicolor FP-101664 SS1]